MTSKSSKNVQDWTLVAQNTITKSTEHRMSDADSTILHLQAGLNTETAHTGTKFIVQTSGMTSGNEDWYDRTTFVALIGTAAKDLVQGSTLAAGSTDIALTGHAYTTEGVWILIEDGTLADSELIFVASQTTNEIVALDPTTNAHIVGSELFNVALSMSISLPVSAQRVRVVIDNSYDNNGSTILYKTAITKVVGL